MANAKLDQNRNASLLAKDTVSLAAAPISGILAGSVEAAAVAMVDGSGNQIVSFGGGTQYTDGGTPPANPIGNAIEWNEGGTWRTVSTAKPLPVSGSFSLTNPTIGAAVPATANYIAASSGGNLTGLLMGSQTTANSLAVVLASNQVAIPVSQSGTWNIGTVTTVSTVTAVTAISNALPAGTNAIGKLAANSGVDIGDVDVTSIAAGTNLIADVGIQPRTTNGLDTFMASGSDGSSILVATAQSIKAGAGKVYGYYAYNPEAAVTFVHFYNTVSGSVTVGTTNPLFTLQIPAGSAANLMSEIGITFGTAIVVAATTTAGGNTAPATGVSLEVWYK